MKDRIAACLASFLFCLLACGASAFAGMPSGAVYVTTLPTDADIWVDGTYVGRAPVLVDALVAGHHALTITRTGWRVTEVDVTVPAGGVAMSSTRLAAGPRAYVGASTGTMILRDVPPGASLELDGAAYAGPAGKPVELSAGVHRIACTTGAGRTTREFTVLPNTSTDVMLRADRSIETRSAVVAPADAYIGADAYEIDGNKIVIHADRHLVIAHFGDTSARYDGRSYDLDAAPISIGGKLYLPLILLEKLADDMSKTP